MTDAGEHSAETRAVFRDRLLRMLGHDLRNPLSSVLMNVRVLLKGGLTEKQLRFATRISTSAEKMDRMIRDLSDFARAHLGAARPIAPVDASLDAICRQAIDGVVGAAPGRIVLEAPEIHGRWDPDRLGRVVAHLVDNGLRHGSADGAVRVDVRDLGTEVSIEVHNQGDPIEASLREHLFDPLLRGGPHDPGSGGLGLGLYLTDLCARAHGGSVSVASEAGSGTTVTLKLPKTTADAAPVSATAPAAP